MIVAFTKLWDDQNCPSAVGFYDRDNVTSLEDISDGETTHRDVLFMQIGIHRSIARNLGREVLRGVERSFNDRAVGLTDANVFQVERSGIAIV